MRDRYIYGIVYIYIIISLVIMMGLGYSSGNANRGLKRMDYIVDSLRVSMWHIQEDVRKRDSVLGVEISKSLGVIEELSRLKGMTRVEIDMLEDSIEVRRRYVDSLSRGMLTW